jgi:hypothetical protein
MDLRSITLGINTHEDAVESLRPNITRFFKKARELFSEQGIDSRTHRIALTPFSITNSIDVNKARGDIACVSNICDDLDVRWFCVPFYTRGMDMARVNSLASDIATQYKNAFLNYLVTDTEGINCMEILYAGEFIRCVSLLSENGFDNFRCGVSCNCKPDGAYFPFSYSSGIPGFALALEMVPLCIQLIKNNYGKPLEKIRNILIENLAPMLRKIEDISKRIADFTGMKYFGIDASFAPHPEHADHSIASLIELLGVERCGSNGTVFMTGFLTDVIRILIQTSGIRATGFNGVMFSILEDPRLGERSAEPGNISIDSLMAWATMCGCGIDMVPIPGDVTAAELASIMLDMAAISIKLGKPLGIRLLPIPGKAAGDITNFDHDFLHNTKVQALKSFACSSHLFKRTLSLLYPFK